MPIDTCPICKRDYALLSQHLPVSHGVKNMEERRLLLALQSGRSARLDGHLKAHTKLTVASEIKRLLCLRQLAALRASELEVLMVSTLDLMEEEEGEVALDQSEEEGAEESGCHKRACVLARETMAQLNSQVAQLNSQVDPLTSTLKELSRRFRIMQRRSHRRPSDFRSRAKNLLSSFVIKENVAEEDAVPRQQTSDPDPSPQHSSSQAEPSPVPVLNCGLEYTDGAIQGTSGGP
ncbi:uncharacterized protein LOC130430649 [Triplophysa dalaica]|uniref:uncharacterized protein LOC130430649 n=1 Tax=Triplophysa dalaica TaxID=1582913 RepID=UPI0024DFE343|nr:uncharacterized protein LOC130430649 [Triplophysa dalaica]